MKFIPYVYENTPRGDKYSDIFSRLLQDRIILMSGEVNGAMASIIVAQLLFLASQDSEKDIMIYINSYGGSVTDMLAIYDTMKYVKVDVSTICLGMAASAAAVVLGGGVKGKRMALTHANIMIHQPRIFGGLSGTATDLNIQISELLKIKETLNKIVHQDTGQPLKQVATDMEHDHYMTAQEAINYGIIDKIIN